MNDASPVTNDPYTLFSRFYDLEFDRVTEDLEFFRQFALEANGPILELGCGSGRVLKALQETGLPLTGIDSSPAMLALARDRLAPSVELILCAMESLVQVEPQHAPFWFAFCAANTFLHLPDTEAQMAALASTRRLVVPGGLLVLDVFVPDPAYLASLDGSTTCEFSTTLEDGMQLDKWVSRTHDLSEQVIETRVWYDVRSMSDGALRRYSDSYATRYVHRFELEHLLSRTGWSVVSLFGSYDLEPYGADAERLLVLATWNEDGEDLAWPHDAG